MSGDLALTPGMTSRASVVAFTVFASGLTFAAQGDSAAITPEEFGTYVKTDVSKWRKLIRDAHLAL